MMSDNQSEKVVLAQSVELIKKDLGLDETIDVHGSIDPMHDLEVFLEKRLGFLLDNDFERLLNALYRMDISESKVKEILNAKPVKEITKALTEAVISREIQKVKTRMWYTKR